MFTNHLKEILLLYIRCKYCHLQTIVLITALGTSEELLGSVGGGRGGRGGRGRKKGGKKGVKMEHGVLLGVGMCYTVVAIFRIISISSSEYYNLISAWLTTIIKW